MNSQLLIAIIDADPVGWLLPVIFIARGLTHCIRFDHLYSNCLLM